MSTPSAGTGMFKIPLAIAAPGRQVRNTSGARRSITTGSAH
jgi:hypothetical protein